MGDVSFQGRSLLATPVHIVRKFGAKAIFRGLAPCAIRDGIYVGCLLGVTPVFQKYLMEEHKFGLSAAGSCTVHTPPSIIRTRTRHLSWEV